MSGQLSAEKAKILGEFALFRGVGAGIESWLTPETSAVVFDRLADLANNPLGRNQLNQLLLLSHEAAMSHGFFTYYWKQAPDKNSHPFQVGQLAGFKAEWLRSESIVSLDHLKWGLTRFYIDALLFFGNIRQGYRELREWDVERLARFFQAKTFDVDRARGLSRRGPALPLNDIPKDDRYLISEMACKSFAPTESEGDMLTTLKLNLRAVRRPGTAERFKIKDLIAGGTPSSRERQGEFEFSAAEFIEETVNDEAELEEKYQRYKRKFDAAREKAIKNTDLYLSVVNDLDVYVATSMRTREDFRRMAENCEKIFGDERLKSLNIRYFDPTLSAARGHEDKGLIECLMVKCAKILIYMAGERDSYGKDAEAAMALSLGKPVIFYCDEDKRKRFYRDVHPLSRLINFQNGVAVGAFVTSQISDVATLLHEILTNTVQYELHRKPTGNLQLLEKHTSSVVRLQTSDRLLTETFWNHYHNRV